MNRAFKLTLMLLISGMSLKCLAQSCGCSGATCTINSSCTLNSDYSGSITVNDGTLTVNANVAGQIDVTNEDATLVIASNVSIGSLDIGKDATVRVNAGVTTRIHGDIDYTGSENGSLIVSGTLNVSGDITCNGGEDCEDNTMSTPGSGQINGGGECQLQSCAGNFNSDPSLPVSLLYFKATQEGSRVKAQWATAQEKNNDYFELERSENGIDFHRVAVVDGAGDSKELQEYVSVDENPYVGDSYYRLVQHDFDGKMEVFNTVHVELFSEKRFSIVGNPSMGNQLEIFMAEESWGYQSYVYSLSGRLLQKKNILPGNNTLFLDSNVNSGIIVVQILNETGHLELSAKILIK